MSDTQTVQPALRPDEWEDMTRDDLSLTSALSHLGDGVGLVDEDGSAMGRRAPLERHRHALMAAANYALPDGHPGKVTRAMVDALERCVGTEIAHLGDRGTLAEQREAYAPDGEVTLAKAAIAALAALLPGEG